MHVFPISSQSINLFHHQQNVVKTRFSRKIEDLSKFLGRTHHFPEIYSIEFTLDLVTKEESEEVK